ncbi:type II toxin-antitoxin system VapC family toxin [Nostoc sp. UHCC 0870]|uniref:type II toxin-antitoxin system VapC family toxin n=1 Tax=Nostoc sp. UHCC 0870 TaxID=2914041 RepID=UPI001EDCF6D6|nr:type II toxin-antitoxin system VapC family toxin [Nostoc sp. UHCC 0870]UKP01505.1 type II toxin-antitoxin system VapC family toxin [Nostoc sp. UHCC 0870]
MSIKYLLDTNIISEATRQNPNVNVVKKLTEHQLETATGSVVMHELLFGCLRLVESQKRRLLLEYINQIPLKMTILNYDLKAAQWHAQKRARLSKMGKTPAFIDGQIASIAYSNNLILVTNNVSDFEFFNDLTVENWFFSSGEG